MTDDNVIQYCMENEFLEVDQEEPDNNERAEPSNAEQEVEEHQIEEDMTDQQINDVLADIVIEPVVHNIFAATADDVIADEDEASDEDADIGADIPDSEDDDDDDNDGDDDVQPIARLQVDELDLTFSQASAQLQRQAPATSLVAIHSTTVSAVELSSIQARVSSDKFINLNEVISQLSDKLDAEKEAQIQKLKTFFKRKMPEIDASVIPQEIHFRRPSVPAGTSSRSSLHDLPISELTDLLYARLLSMSPPQHQDQDLISLLRNFQPTPPPVPTSDSERITALSEEFQSFRSKVESSFADLKSFMTQAFSELSNRFDLHTQSCRTEAAREDQFQEEVVGDTEKNVDNVQDCRVEDLMNVMLENIDMSEMSNTLNFSEQDIKNNMQIVVYIDPDTASRPIDLEESEAANDMRSFFANFIEINSDDDEDIRFEKICQVKEEDCDDIIIISDTEDDSVFMDAKEKEITDMLYKDLPSQEEIPETSPSSGNSEVKRAWVGVVPGWVTPWEVSHQVARNKSVRYTLVKSRGKADNIVVEAGGMLQMVSEPLLCRSGYGANLIEDDESQGGVFVARNKSVRYTLVKSRGKADNIVVEAGGISFEVGHSSRAQADVPPSEPVIPPTILEEGPSLTRQERQRSLQQRYMASRQRSAFLEDSQCNIFVSRRRSINICAILGVEKESEAYQYEYLMLIKCQRRRNNLVSSTHLIVRVISVTINKFIRRQIRFFRVFDFQMVVESFQPVVNLLRPNRSLPDLDFYPLFTIIQDPYGVVYKNGSSQKCFLIFEEIGHYSDGTLKVIKRQLEQRLKEAQRRFLETRNNAFLIDNDEIRLLKKTLNTIHERLNFRSTLRRLEVSIGLNRLRQREERQ
ncbi:hypothetical protein L6452_06155 [Arctium lappa]|uniref:Uncharacterized protein n=1 Tax=Arctium lappa TaxID=4217 RepID=A0ACB9EHS7_ARCLA|nr:hypothetical protein L6452_06155 [Arctium lappa]